MYFSIGFAAVLAAGFTAGAPLESRANTYAVDDVLILNYALTLEYLERKFYQEGLKNYTQAAFIAAGFPNPFYENLNEIYFDEKTHVDVLYKAINAVAPPATTELKYCFPSTTPASFVALSSVLEGVGVSAYLGAAAFIMNKDYLTIAGQILTIEARHSAYIRSVLQQSPFPAPFDTPLDFNEVYSLAAAFICGGSSPVKLPFKAFPALALECSQYYYEADHSSVTFTGAFTAAQKFSAAITKTTPIYAFFFSGLVKTAVQVRITQGDKDYKVDKIPAGVQGQTYVVLSKSPTDASDDHIIAGPAILETYPKGKVPSKPLPKCL